MAKNFGRTKNYFSKVSALFGNKFFYAGVFLTVAAVIFSFGVSTVSAETGVLQISAKSGDQWELFSFTVSSVDNSGNFQSQILTAGERFWDSVQLPVGSYNITTRIPEGWKLSSVECPLGTFYSGNDVMVSASDAQIRNVSVRATITTPCVFTYEANQTISPDTGFLRIKTVTTDTKSEYYSYNIVPVRSEDPRDQRRSATASVQLTDGKGSSQLIILRLGPTGQPLFDRYNIQFAGAYPEPLPYSLPTIGRAVSCNVIGKDINYFLTPMEGSGWGIGAIFQGFKVYPGEITECIFIHDGEGGGGGGYPIDPNYNPKLKIIVETSGGEGNEEFRFYQPIVLGNYNDIETGELVTSIKTERVRQDPDTGEWISKGEWIGKFRPEGMTNTSKDKKEVFQAYSEGWVLNKVECDTGYRFQTARQSTRESWVGGYAGINLSYTSRDTITCVFTSTKAPPSVINAGKIRLLKVIYNQNGNNLTFDYTTNFGQSPSLITRWDSQGFEQGYYHYLYNPNEEFVREGGSRAVAEWFSKNLSAGPNFAISEKFKEGWEIKKAACFEGGGGVFSGDDGRIYFKDISVRKGVATTCIFENQKSEGGGAGKLIIIKKTPNNTNSATFNYAVFPSPSGLSVTTVNGTGVGSNVIASLDSSIKYDIAENPLSGWTPTSAVCALQDGRSAGSPSASGNSVSGVEIIPDQTTTCVFENTSSDLPPPPPPGTGKIKVIKNASGGTGSDIFYFSSNIKLSYLRTSGTSSSARAEWISKPLAAGSTYKISEIVRSQSGWTLSPVLCDKPYDSLLNGAKNITVVANQTTTCAFTNRKALLSRPKQ